MIVHQPTTVVCAGVTYTLVSPFRAITEDPPVSEGPFYGRPGVDPRDWAFTPDARFLGGLCTEPSFMHCIQQCAAPSTPRPV